MSKINTKERVLYEVFNQFTNTYSESIIEAYDSIIGGKINTSKLSTADILDLAYCVADEIEKERKEENAS